MTQAPDYGRAFALMRRATGETWQAYTCHDFVAGLGDGTLPRAAFLHYLRQDYIFLKHFARAWALAVVKAQNLEEMGACAATVHALLHEEMPLHEGICAEAGIPKVDLEATEERPENLAYTRFVMDAGFSGDFVGLLSALAPCVFGYGEIGQRLVQGASSEAYADWIATYGGDEYQDLCKAVGAMLDTALEARLGKEFETIPVWQSYLGTFRQATLLEVRFWQMGLDP